MSLHLVERSQQEIDPLAMKLALHGVSFIWRPSAEFVERERAFLALRRPTLFDVATAPAHLVVPRARNLPCLLRTSVAAAGRSKALKWAQEWLKAGCPGVALPLPRAGWRAARIKGGGVALYDSDADRGFLWLSAPPWFQGAEAFEEIWYTAAVRALPGAGV